MNVLRWISLPFVWVLAFLLGNILAYVMNLDLMLYAVGPYAAVASTAFVAPKGKRYVATVFATITTLLLLLSAFGYFDARKWFKGILCLIGIVGAIFPAIEDYHEPTSRA